MPMWVSIVTLAAVAVLSFYLGRLHQDMEYTKMDVIEELDYLHKRVDELEKVNSE